MRALGNGCREARRSSIETCDNDEYRRAPRDDIDSCGTVNRSKRFSHLNTQSSLSSCLCQAE
jgi:hypothetical protein